MGQILGPFGVKGWVKCKVFTETLESLESYPMWMISQASGDRELRVEGFEVHPPHIIAKLQGVEDRDRAFELRGAEIGIPRSALPPPNEGEWYWADLLGLEVINVQGELLGRVEDLLETGAHDVLVVRGDVERLIPFVSPILIEVSLPEGRIQVDWGLDY
jgi:16S rRNA processing protein RimM